MYKIVIGNKLSVLGSYINFFCILEFYLLLGDIDIGWFVYIKVLGDILIFIINYNFLLWYFFGVDF